MIIYCLFEGMESYGNHLRSLHTTEESALKAVNDLIEKEGEDAEWVKVESGLNYHFWREHERWLSIEMWPVTST